MELPTKYQSKDIEAKWYPAWEKNGYFTPNPDSALPRDKRFTIVIPPPNVTGILHMGHALNNTIQDILVRFERMRGKLVLWVPGVDHAGIATQNVVEKKLAKEKKNRHTLGREKFIEEVWKWKESHGSTIVRQLRRLGASCDWTRERFTMDEGLSRAVRECFVSLYERGLIYQGDYIINWCPRCQTALSDEESAHQEMEGNLYHIRYPLEGGGHLVVATTRPETMLGDTAVAVNPNDTRYAHLAGKHAILPLLSRRIPIVADEFVDPEFGTGLVKVTPAHDPNDFAFHERHPEAALINVLHPDGRVNENGGPYAGLDRFEARKKIIQDLDAQGLFEKKVSHRHAVGHCYRCHTMVEPYLSTQWFVRMKPMAEKAIKAYERGETKFVPERWNKVYLHWLENIRDWCISRQIWWGHQIPVWYCGKCQSTVDSPKSIAGNSKTMDHGLRTMDSKKGIIVSRTDITHCPHCGFDKIRRDPDVLDTWFSSWLWPFSTLGWPEKTKDLERFYPTSVLVTAPEIIFFWVARMIMAGLEFTGKVPFHTVYIHGTVRTDTGQKMSKSLGNAIDPLTVIDEIGADALRFSIIMLTASGQDAYLSREKFELGRNFTNKIWNASRFILMNLGTEKQPIAFESLSLVDKWILTEFSETAESLMKSIEQYRLNDAATTMYHFFWHSFCDWYLELAKPVLQGQDPERAKTVRSVLIAVLDGALRLLHPFMPFVTEEIWQHLKEHAADERFEKPSLMLSDWPFANAFPRFEKEAGEVRLFQEAVAGIRDLRARLEIPVKRKMPVTIVSSSKEVIEHAKRFQDEILHLTNSESIEWRSSIKKEPGMVGKVFPHMEIFIEGVLQADLDKEIAKMHKRIGELETYIRSLDQKLTNSNFLSRAPEELVLEQREKKAGAEKELTTHRENLAVLSGN